MVAHGRDQVLHRPTWVAVLAVSLAFLSVPAARSGDADRPSRRAVQAFSGEDPNHYPPDCPVDFLHLKLDLLFADLHSRSFVGKAQYTLRPVHGNVTSLRLDAVDLRIRSVKIGDAPARYDYDDRQLTVQFDSPLPRDEDTVLTIAYECVEPIEGMIWALPDDGYPDRPLVIHTQGEAIFSRHWFPCLDSPVDRCTTEVTATVPAPFMAISNGKLIEKRGDPPTNRTTFHYRQEQPHVFYLVSLVIGRFNEVDDEWHGKPVQYFVPPGQGEFARLTYGKTPQMMDCFSDLLHFEYPYDKYSQVNVPLFMFGGMENTSATTMTDGAILTPRAAVDQDLEGLISHELAHQWFGDLITCRSWEHIWLNEGFATFMASVWKERSKGREEYLYEFWKRYQSVVRNHGKKGKDAVLFSDYRYPFEVFRHEGSLPYSKGSCVLNMLRHQLGDELFWRAISTYVRRYAYSQVETDDLRRVIEVVSGRNLEQFFTQWMKRPGVPELDVWYHWDPEKQMATVEIDQTQLIDEDRPAYATPLDLYFRSGGEVVTATVDLSQRRDVYRRRFHVKPDLFCVDPEAGLLMELECEKPKSMWLAQLVEGPTTIARCVAAKHLAKFNRPEVAEALRAAAANAHEHWTVRSEAATALGATQTEHGRKALLALIADANAMADPKARAAILAAAGKYDTPEIGAAIAPFAAADPSLKVEAAATEALGGVRRFDAEELLISNTAKDSLYNQIRAAAIKALAQRNDREAVEVAERFAAYGNDDRLRPTAIRALGRLARDNPDRRDEIRAALARWLTDPQDRALAAAIEALADIGDEESQDLIRQRMAGAMKLQHVALAEDALARARPEAESQTVESLKEEFRDLRRRFRQLTDDVDRLEALEKN